VRYDVICYKWTNGLVEAMHGLEWRRFGTVS